MMNSGNSNIEGVLQELRDKGTIMALYLNSADAGTFSIGIVLAVSESHVVLGCLDEYGEEDGCSISPVDDTLKIEVGDVYTESIRLLFESADDYKKSSYQAWHSALRIADNHPEPTYLSLLGQAQSEQKVITAYEYDGPATSGFVQWKSDETFALDVIGRSGLRDGSQILKLENVRKICYSGKQERKLLRLMHIRRVSERSS